MSNSTAADLQSLVGEVARIRGDGVRSVSLTLVAALAAPSGPARPAHLLRQDGVVLVFDGPDIASLVAGGHGLYTVRMPRLGAERLYMGPVPKRSGGHTFEAVLN